MFNTHAQQRESMLLQGGTVTTANKLGNGSSCIHSCSRTQIVADAPHLVAWPAVSTTFWKPSSSSVQC
ncbi:hypothetical protein AMELA_G00218080 [Ameiurus melas]|uniref:Uncharacterized protein n=1 Tax=Ameiurus melas TaxID=219545 RepID=A0A7J6A3D9_AMEME|nr:hypothetical protein AMELA_G00218080 [Ameiurus melas]